LAGWSKRKAIVLTGGASGAQTAFQLKLIVTFDGDMQSDFDDLRFTQADGTTLIDAWLETKTDDTSATVWAEFPTTPANTVEQTYYMYYGNAGAVSDWDGTETFEFFDDFENTTSPVLTTSDEVHGGGSPYYLDWPESVKVVGDYAYVCSFLGNSFGIYDISDKINIILKDVISGAGAPNYLNGAHHCDIVGNYAYVTGFTDHSLVILNISDKTNITLVGEIHGAGSPNYLNNAAGVVVDGNYAYVAAGGDDSLTVIDVSTPSSPSYVAKISGAGSPNYLNGPYMLIKEGNYLYVSSYIDNALVIIDVSTPSSPSLVGEIHGAGSPNYLDGGWGLAQSGNYVYVAANHDNSLTVIDVSTPSSPSFHSNNTSHASGIDDVVVSGNYIYAACIGENGISIYDISIPGTPVYDDGIFGTGPPNYLSACHGVFVVGDYIYQAARDDDSFSIISYYPGCDVSGWTTEAGTAISGVINPVRNGNYAANITNSTGWNEVYKSVGSNVSDRVFEFYARSPSLSSSQFLLIEPVGGTYANAVYVWFDTSGTIKYYDGSFHTLQPFSINTWYRFKITTHVASSLFDIEIDGVNKGTNLGTRGNISAGINAISFMGGNNTARMFVDMIFMRKYAANPPTYAFGAEESAPTDGNPFWYYNMLKRRNS
jgi:hypothetical protein